MSHDIIVLNFILTILHNIFLFEDNLHKVLPFNVSIVLELEVTPMPHSVHIFQYLSVHRCQRNFNYTWYVTISNWFRHT